MLQLPSAALYVYNLLYALFSLKWVKQAHPGGSCLSLVHCNSHVVLMITWQQSRELPLTYTEYWYFMLAVNCSQINVFIFICHDKAKSVDH